MKWLREDLKSDKWITTRFRMLTAGPRRIPFKNLNNLKNEYRFNFYSNMLIAGLACWPLGVLVGKMMMTSSGGVSLAPITALAYNHPDVHPMATTFKRFKRGSFLTCATLGYLIAWKITDDSMLKDELHTRPDMKPFPAMIRPGETDLDPLVYDTIRDQLYKDTKVILPESGLPKLDS
mmetsp:Transcript_11820/g.19979  ORF Transcript_11820/g.19979 Transcript_11820/m.19979 type:complete len:178 (+) Transcript_11820:176-709(+)